MIRQRQQRNAIVLVLVICLGGCVPGLKDVHTKPVPLDARLVAKIGLPVYPNASPQPMALQMHMTVSTTTSDATSAQYLAGDELARVEAWYQTKMPKGSEVTHLHLGVNGIAEFQVASGTTIRKVQLTGVAGKTQIQLMVMRLQAPSPSPT